VVVVEEVEAEEDTEMAGMVDPLEVDIIISIINPVNPSHQTTSPTTLPPAENPPQQSTSQMYPPLKKTPHPLYVTY
jgi:hypothetical protein